MISVSCSVFITNENKILLVRENKVNKWGLPGGRIELDETLPGCAIRECREETGLEVEIKDLIFISQKSHSREGNNVVRFIYSAEIVGEINEKEMTYQYFARKKFEQLAAQDKIRGKDVIKLAQDFYDGKIEKFNRNPEVF